MDMVQIMVEVLSQDAKEICDNAEDRQGKQVARVIGEQLARASMDGDIKAAAMLMELAGMDFRSRDSLEKHEIDRQKLSLGKNELPRVVFEDARPEERE